MIHPYPPRDTSWLVTAPLRDRNKRILLDVIDAGHGTVVARRPGGAYPMAFDILTWERMNPVRSLKRERARK